MNLRFGLILAAAGCIHAQSDISIEHVTLIDGTGRPAIPDSCVLVNGGKISKVAACSNPSPAARHIDGKGKFLIPGLMDIHVHLRGSLSDEPAGIRALHSYLYSGITTI